MIVRFFFFLNFILLICNILEAQEIRTDVYTAQKKKYYFLQPKFHHGFLLPHHESFKYYQRSYIQSFEVNIGKDSDGEKLWQQLHKYPTLGFGYYYTDLQYVDVLGKAHAVYGFINQRLNKSRRFSIKVNSAIGLGYLTKHFDNENNVENIAISTHFNIYAHLGFEAHVSIHKQINGSLGVGFSHFSNGAFKMPNKGINLISANVGLKYNFYKDSVKFRRTKITDYKPTTHYTMTFAVGRKEFDLPEQGRFTISSLSFSIVRKISYIREIGIGLDLFFDPSKRLYFENNENFDSSNKDYLSAGLHFSYNIIYGKTTFIIQQGIYLLQKPLPFESIYGRFGFRYDVCKHAFFNLTLRTYLAQANFVEWGVGYKFGK